ncbi:class I SAM-dependent methyltransferase [Parachryseolinea silvisoli]|uniref:class I SAM-dependent methyltransferase n=1 Tax=Parachryseolinea silvisoli TaxID=2873601 RepID=UPI0022658314|nr:class I SAM-dependent methyltransferase [Parachryseolinea silvisoli]
MKYRGQSVSGIGTSAIRQWAGALPPGAAVLDLGCGTGLPVTHVLVEESLTAYGIDASPTLVAAFRQNFPGTPVACEAAEESAFFNRQFDAVIAVGLLFLLPAHVQEMLIRKVSHGLNRGGKFLFTSPAVKTDWVDILTGQSSTSPGAAMYQTWLSAAGLTLREEFEDEGNNHYYHAVKHEE